MILANILETINPKIQNNMVHNIENKLAIIVYSLLSSHVWFRNIDFMFLDNLKTTFSFNKIFNNSFWV
jgi:hypothetical protein